MYGSMKSIGILCCFLTISESIVYGVVFGIAKPGEVGKQSKHSHFYSRVQRD